MEAELVRELPEGDGWQYEPKWDGFRGVLENVGGEVALWSRNERPLLRYFPELRPLGELLPPSSALDGEIVIARDGALDFDAMQTRLHPAESRIRRLSAEIPAEYVAFDMLLWDGEPVWELPLDERRARVEALSSGGFRVSPATRSVDEARGWLDRFEALGLDGVVAKRLGVPYLPGSREGMAKVKEHKAADCVVVGIRWKGDRAAIATLLLGLYRDDGELDYVGSAAVAARTRDDVAARVLPLLDEKSDRRFSEPNRWGSGELEEAAGTAGARGRGALRQGAGEPLPPRHEAAALAGRQGSERLHVARAAPAARPERAGRRVAVRCLTVSAPPRAANVKAARAGHRGLIEDAVARSASDDRAVCVLRRDPQAVARARGGVHDSLQISRARSSCGRRADTHPRPSPTAAAGTWPPARPDLAPQRRAPPDA